MKEIKSLYVPEGMRYNSEGIELARQTAEQIGKIYKQFTDNGYYPPECKEMIISTILSEIAFIDLKIWADKFKESKKIKVANSIKQFAVYEKEPAHGKEPNSIILAPFDTEELAETARLQWGYNNDNYYVDEIKK